MSDYIKATNYIRRNGWIVLRQALPVSDTESWQSLWLNKFGNLEDFPWVDLYGSEPTEQELIRMGFLKCPTCHRSLNKEI